MNLTRQGLRMSAATMVLLVVGCTRLEMADLPPDPALPASEAAFWNDIADVESGDWFYLLNTGDEALEWRLRMIDSARVSIDMETFLWKPDESGRQIVAHVLAAADRGVRVRFLLDDSFTMHEDLALHAIDEHPNISFRLYNPFQSRSNSAFWREMFDIGEFSRTNHRMHNKVLVVDGRATLVGGRNLADEYFGLNDGQNFRDMEVITAGASVPQVTRHFDAFWNSGWAFPITDVISEPADAADLTQVRAAMAQSSPPAAAPNPAELAAQWQAIARAAFPGRASFFFDEPASRDPAAPDEVPDQLAGILYKLIDDAQSEVILISAYLVPTPELETVVERVEARGVKVRILTNSLGSNNHLSAHAAYRKHLQQLLEHGADLHEVRADAADRHLYIRQPVDDKPLGLHAKLLLIDDDIAFVGSCNLDPRSLKINTEVGLVIESAALNGALREMLAIDFRPGNAWAVRRTDDGELIWIGDGQIQTHDPGTSGLTRLEDWFIGLLPIDGEM
jgi:putative cardiolipin synthase